MITSSARRPCRSDGPRAHGKAVHPSRRRGVSRAHAASRARRRRAAPESMPRSVRTPPSTRPLTSARSKRASRLCPEQTAQLCVVERGPAPREPDARGAVRGREASCTAAPGGPSSGVRALRATAAALRTPTWDARRSRRDRGRGRRRRVPASSRATASPAKLAPQTTTSGARRRAVARGAGSRTHQYASRATSRTRRALARPSTS